MILTGFVGRKQFKTFGVRTPDKFHFIFQRVMFGILLASIVALAELYFMAKSAEI